MFRFFDFIFSVSHIAMAIASVSSFFIFLLASCGSSSFIFSAVSCLDDLFLPSILYLQPPAAMSCMSCIPNSVKIAESIPEQNDVL